jgi:hypothetical protein
MHVIKQLVGHKCDLGLERNVANSKEGIFLEASAKTKRGIRQAFLQIVNKKLGNPIVLKRAVF